MSAVQFILGRSGTGKTHACIEQVRAALADAPEGPPLVLLVPEQATFQVERALIESPDGPNGFHRARVLSFRRFAHLVFNEVGGPADPPISALAKQMALRAVLEPMRERLGTFAASLDRPGFLARLADTFGEFHRYLVTAEMLRERAKAESRRRLADKLLELADAFDAFNAYLRQGRFTDPDAALTEASARLARSGLACGARVWVDGFAGFTPQELAFLGELAALAERLHVALVLDPDDLPDAAITRAIDVPPGRLFRRTEQTLLRLEWLFRDQGVPVVEPLLLRQVRRFEAAPMLAALEGELFAPDAPRRPPGAAPRAVSRSPSPLDASLLTRRDDELLLIEAPDRRAEVRAAANHVRHLVTRFGYRYRNVAVILRSLDDYWPFIVEAFGDADIPFFLDRRQPISHHPLVELLRSAVGTVSRRMPATDVIAYLKTDLPAAAASGGVAEFRDAVDRLENYALAYGLAGPAWFEPGAWRFHESTAFGQEDLSDAPPPPGLEQMVQTAGQALAPLAELHRCVADAGGSPTVAQWTAALWRLMVRLNVERTLEDWSEAEPLRADSTVHAQAFDSVVELLGDLARALGDRAMGGVQFAEVLEAGLSQLTLGLVPPALDQVLVGAIERSRHPRIRAALVLGIAERSFPRARPVQAILTDADRQDLAGKDVTGRANAEFDGNRGAPAGSGPIIELAPGRGEALFDEDLMAYLALTRPGERLWVSWPAADQDGRPVNPSRYVRLLRERLADLPLVRLADQPAVLSAVTAGELSACLAGEWATGTAGGGGPAGTDGATGRRDGGATGAQGVPTREFSREPLASASPDRATERGDVATPQSTCEKPPSMEGRGVGVRVDRRETRDFHPSPCPLPSRGEGSHTRSQTPMPDARCPKPLTAALYELIRTRSSADLARTMAALGYANEPALSPGAARTLFASSGVVSGSATRLESFAACPFKHFADFGLRLRPRDRIELDALQLGSFYHELLRQLFERLGPPPVDWSGRPVEELRRLVGELVGAARGQLSLPRLSAGAGGYVLAQAEQVLGDLAEAMHAAADASGGVRQVAAELLFGDREAGLDAVRLDLGDGASLRIRGKIDRVDLAPDGGVFVIDYKTGQTVVNWSAIHHGLSVQLPAYLLAIRQNADAQRRMLPAPRAAARGRAERPDAHRLPESLHPAGAFFQRIAVRPSSADPPPSGAAEPDRGELLAPYQRRGVFLADAAGTLDAALDAGGSSPFVRFKLNKDGRPAARGNDAITRAELDGLLAWSSGRMAEFARAILAGEAGVRPYRLGSESPCTWCDFRAVCRLDFDYNRPRYLAARRREEVLAELAGRGQ